MPDLILRAVVTLASAAALALGSWNVATVASTKTEVAVQKQRTDDLKSQLERIEDKLDRILERR